MTSPLARFKKQKAPGAPWLDAADAARLDADTIGAVLGLAVEHQGRHVELANGMRGTDRDGRLVWCHKDGTGIGDTMALVQAVTGLAFRPALELLLGESAPRPQSSTVPAAPRQLRLPRGTDADRIAGRAYLAGRGVSSAALDAAEACDMLHHIDGAVLFVGYEGRKPRSATRRGYGLDDPMPKRDLAGTNKTYPAVIPGQPSEIWIVEGGTDALALMTLHPSIYPTVIVTGGSNVTSWLDNPAVQARLDGAKRCTVAGEREKNDETQQKTDEQRRRLVERLLTRVPDVAVWMPPAGCKDLAEMLTSAVTLASDSKS